ncbi:MAG: LPS assembly lipoprotein LptE [Pseudomonadota bacterium]
MRARTSFLLLALFALHVSLLLSACGFHLRGAGKAELPATLSTLRVAVEGSQAANDPLLAAMKTALRTQAGVTLVDSVEAPLLLLFGEHSDSQVLSVGTTGKADEYLLKYEVSFRLVGVDGKTLAEAQTVKLQRDHAFDRFNVIAKEREEADLRRGMQRDAVQQILRRLARITLKPSEPAANANQR